MKQRKPLEILSLLSALGAVACTPWCVHGAVKSSDDCSKTTYKSVQDEEYDIDVGVASSTLEPPSGEVVDGPD